MDDVLEDDGVNVLAQQVDEEPVAHIALGHDHLDALALDAAVAHAQGEGANVRAEHDGEAVDQHQEGQQPQEEQPEPDEDVNLLVDNVERQDAEGVVLLNVARRAKLVKGALGHSREDIDHGIDAIFLITVGKGHHFDAIREKGPIKEPVQEEHLTCTQGKANKADIITHYNTSKLSFCREK